MNRSLLTMALCLALAPMAVACDGGPDIEEEEAGESQDAAEDGDAEETEEEATDEEDADPSDADIDDCEEGENGFCGTNGTMECIEAEPGHFVWDTFCNESGSSSSTPLVLSFDGVEPAMIPGASGAFDLSGSGVHGHTDWPAASTPWLALDRDGDGRIADGSELFGSAVRLASGDLATQGFEALAELDANGDHVIDARDPRFGELLVWGDADGDRASQGHELSTASQRGLVSIELGSRSEVVCDARGNCGVERAAFTYHAEDGSLRTGEVVDIHLAYQR
jgi:hypothetical protein